MLSSVSSISHAQLTTPRVALARPQRAAVRVHAAAKINDKIKLDEPKVVDTVQAKDISKQGVFCRCWKSDTFPLCNGAHVKHNKEVGDNVGPLIIKE
ncbi:hypothetical protein WJX72_001495 [[Myrmecia] bisecta]|uniref:Iron-binding zinc finger CDGSH type domain-containing protein n=1 Tax=[Myrmecia] bisecta TaxID=41462 RepID=A0AAW1QE51_9CHLO